MAENDNSDDKELASTTENLSIDKESGVQSSKGNSYQIIFID